MLPEDAAFSITSDAVGEVEKIVREVSAEKKMPLEAMSSFVGGGGPRFWYSLSPESPHPNYAQVVLVLQDKHHTHHLLPHIQRRVEREIAGARIDVRQLETGDSVGLPVAIRVSGDDIGVLRASAERVAKALREVPLVTRIRDNWGEDRFNVELKIDTDRANLAGLTNRDIAGASSTAVSGSRMTTLRDGDKQIPVVARMRTDEFATLRDVGSLYAFSNSGKQKVPVSQVANLDYSFSGEVIRRRNQFRTVTVSGWPHDGVLPSEVMAAARPSLQSIAASLPPGYTLEIGGEEEKQVDGFGKLSVVLATSVAAIFMALTFQFKNAIKPLIVFAAVPFGAVGAFAALYVMGAPFGFMAFLGVISLVGVIVSHIIVLFDFIEEKHAEGEPFEEAVLDAGIMRLRPVLITVGATVFGLIPLALHGGPLWEPLCYAQIGGLTAATFITLLLVPVLRSAELCRIDSGLAFLGKRTNNLTVISTHISERSMVTKTIRKNIPGTILAPPGGGILEYRLTIRGAAANFGWSDDKEVSVLTHTNFSPANEVVWKLVSERTPEGIVRLTALENPAYERRENPGATTVYALSLGFVTAAGYTLVVRQISAEGTVLKLLTDIDYASDHPADSVNEVLVADLA